MVEVSSSQPPQTCWQCQAQHQSCSIKRMSRSRDFATLFPYGDPTVLTYDNVSCPQGPESRAGGAAGHGLWGCVGGGCWDSRAGGLGWA